MSNQWLRWHIGTCEDGKFRMIARNGKVTVGNAIALWSLLLEDASHPDHRGICTRGSDYYGAILDLESEDVARILSAMEQVEMIGIIDDEIRICNWNKRQFESDSKDPTNAERQRRFKEKRKANATKTDGNGPVTGKKHQIQNTDTEEAKASTPDSPKLTKMPFDELPFEWREWAVSEKGWDDSIIRDVWALFREYWQVGRGKNTKRGDWGPTWHVWCRKENYGQKSNGVNYGKTTRTKHDLIAEGIAAARAKREQAASGSFG